MRTWHIIAQVIACDFSASSSVPYMAYISHVVTGVWCGEEEICDDRVCVLFVSSRLDIVFNQRTSAITDHNKSAKDIDPTKNVALQIAMTCQ